MALIFIIMRPIGFFLTVTSMLKLTSFFIDSDM